MKIRDYFKTRMHQLLVFIIYMGTLIFLLNTINTTHDTKLLIILLSFVYYFLSEVLNYYREFFLLKESLPDQESIAGFLNQDFDQDAPGSFAVMMMQTINLKTQCLLKDYISEEKNNKAAFNKYLDIWVHEIKTPLSGLMLLTDNKTKNTENLEIMHYLKQIDYYADQIVSVSKVKSTHNDYHIKRCSLDKIVEEVLSDLSYYFINKKISLIWEPSDFYVYTDSKWLQYMLKQSLLNAIQFTPSYKKIFINTKQNEGNIVIQIRDEGIGISEDKLKRVFERGFTGRDYDKSTGMGLYLIKEMSERLGIDVFVRSKDGFTIGFKIPQTDHYFRM